MNKNTRLSGEVSSHAQKNMQCSSRSTFNMMYVSALRHMLVEPLLKSPPEVEQAVDLSLDYDLLKEDFESIQELGVWSKEATKFSKVDSKIKAAFTRMYKKKSAEHQFPYPEGNVSKSKAKKSDQVQTDFGSGAEEISSDEDEEVKKPVKKAAAKKKAAPKKSTKKK